jgi:hypothetical protein
MHMDELPPVADLELVTKEHELERRESLEVDA